MSKTTIEAEIKDVVIKRVSKGADGAYGIIYVPKAWIGKTVYAVLQEAEKK